MAAGVIRRFELVFLLSGSELWFAAGVILLSEPFFDEGVIRLPELLLRVPIAANTGFRVKSKTKNSLL